MKLGLKTFLFIAFAIIVSMLITDVNAESERVLKIHYTRFDNTIEEWNLWLWPHEPVSSIGGNYSFDHTVSGVFSVATINLSQTNMSQSTKIGILVRTAGWVKDIQADRYIDLVFDDNNEMNVYLVQSVSTIFSNEAAALAERNKLHLDNGLEYRIENNLASFLGTNWQLPGRYGDELTIPSGILVNDQNIPVTRIAANAFRDNVKHSVIHLPETITHIESRAFQNSNMNFITLPSGLQSIGEFAFADNPILREIFIPSTVTHVENNAFNVLPYDGKIYLESASVPSTWSQEWYGKNVHLILNYSGENYIITVDNLRYFVYDSRAKLLGYDVIPNIGSGLVVPDTITFTRNSQSVTVPVVQVGANAFTSLRPSITNIEIGSNVKEIEYRAFNFNLDVTTISFPANSQLTAIYESALYAFIRIEDLVLPSGLKYIGPNALGYLGLSSRPDLLIIPSSVIYVGPNAFMHSPMLIATESEEFVNRWSPDWSNGTQGVSIGEVPRVEIVDGFKYMLLSNQFATLFNTDSNFSHPNNLTIPNAITVEGSGYTVTRIADDAFRNLGSVRSITLPSTIEEDGISGKVFRYLNQLTSIDVSNSSENYVSVDGVLFNKMQTRLISYPPAKTNSSYELPNSVVEISESAFQLSRFLRNLLFDDDSQLETISQYAFSNSRVKLMELPDSLVSVKDYAFSYNNSLSALYIPSTVQSIETNAFFGSNITILLSSSDVPTEWAAREGILNQSLILNYDGRLETVTVNNLEYLVIDEVAILLGFDNSVTVDTNLVIPAVISYNGNNIPVEVISSSSFINEEHLINVQIGANVRKIGSYAFHSAYRLQTVTFAEQGNLKSIGNWAFHHTDLRNVILPDGLETIEDYAFAYLDSLKTIFIPESVTYVGYHALYSFSEQSAIITLAVETDITNWNTNWYNSNFTTVYRGLPSRVEQIGSFYFLLTADNNATLIDYIRVDNETNIIIPSGILVDNSGFTVTSIAPGAFNQGWTISQLSLPETIINISESSFNGLGNLRSIVVEDGNTTYSSSSGILYDSDFLTLIHYPKARPEDSFVLPNSVKVIAPFAFRDNRTLKALLFDDSSLEVIGREAFTGSNLQYILLPSGLQRINENAFLFSQNLRTVYIPGSVEFVGNRAFGSWNTKTEVFIQTTQNSVLLNWSPTWIDQNVVAYYGFAGTIDVHEESNLRYLLHDDKAYLLGFATLPTSPTNLVIPSVVNNDAGSGFEVTVIQGGAFRENYYIQDVIIPNTVKTIGRSAFQATSMQSITFEPGSKLETIEESAFWNSSQLRDIVLPSGLKSIGHSAFAYIWNLRTLRIPSTVTTVGSFALGGWVEQNLTIIVDSEEQTRSWDSNWNPLNHQVYYGDSFTIHEDATYVYWIVNNEAIIMGFVNNNVINRLNIPSKVVVNNEEIAVTKIGPSAFSENQNLVRVVIPSSITEIGVRAFAHNWRLEEVIFAVDSNLEIIASRAFAHTGIRDIRIPSSVKSIGTEAFVGSWNLFNITFPQNSQLESLGTRAFAHGTRATSIELPAGIQNISAGALSYMYNLTSITIHESNQYYATVDGVLYSKDLKTLIAYPIARVENHLVIPKEVERIENSAFRSTQFLNQISFEEGSQLKSIGSSAFHDSLIKTINLPSSLTTIEDLAFFYAQRLSYINIPSSVTRVAWGAFTFHTNVFVESSTIPSGWDPNWNYGSSNVFLGQTVNVVIEDELEYLILDGKATFIGVSDSFNSSELVIPNIVPNSNYIVHRIGAAALQANPFIQRVTIPENVEVIGTNAFNRMARLTQVTFNENSKLHTIENEAFSQTNLLQFRVPRSVVEIHEYAFAWNHHLQFVTIPNNVEIIRHDAFAGGRPRLLILIEASEVPSTWAQNWYGWQEKAVILNSTLDVIVQDYVQYIVTRDQKAHVVGIAADHPRDITIPSGITVGDTGSYDVISILSSAFEQNPNITSIHISSNIKEIGDQAFAYSQSLQTVTFEANSKLEIIGQRAFAHTSIQSFTLPDSVKRIRDEAFAYNYRLEEFTITSNSELEYIGNGAFQWNYSLRSFFIPANVNEIERNPFKGMHNLNEITVDPGNNNYRVTHSSFLVGSGANEQRLITYIKPMYYHEAISISIPDEITIIEEDAFRDSWNINQIIFSSGSQLKRIERFAFVGSQIRSISLPDTVERIGEYAFAWNWNLQSVFIPSSVSRVEYYAFFSGNPGMDLYILDEAQVSTWDFSWNHDNKNVIYGAVELFDDSYSGFTYRIEENNGQEEAIIVGVLSDQQRNESFNIPQQITYMDRNIDVVEIGSNAFNRNYELRSITIPNTIKRIGAGAFTYAYNLNEVIFDETSGVSQLEFIGNGAFMATGLRNVTLPKSVEVIEERAFSNIWQLESFEFEAGSMLTTLESEVFAWNYNLKGIEIPGNVNSINPSVFRGNHNLAEIRVSPSNGYYSSLDGVLYNLNQTRLVSYPGGKQTSSFTIPDSVVQIEAHSFYGINNLTSVTFTVNSNLSRIGHQAFAQTRIRSISLPPGLREIEDYAFAWSYQLMLISIPDNVTYVGYDIFSGGSQDLIVFLESSEVLNTWNPFWNLQNRKVVFNSFIEIVEDTDLRYVISGDEAVVFGAIKTDIQSIVIPSEISYNNELYPVTRISTSAFEQHNSLTSITIPSSIKAIDARAFNNTYSLNAVIFSGASILESIGEQAFMNTSLTSFTLPSSVQTLGSYAFSSNYNLTTFNFEAGSSLEVIRPFTFAWTGIENVEIPSGIKRIEEHAYHNAYRLNSLTFGSNSQLQSIGSYAFAWSYNLTTVTLPSSLSSIQESAFRGSTQISAFNVEAGNNNFVSDSGVLFNYDKTVLIAYPPAKSASNYTVPATVLTIKSDAFSYSRFLTSVTFNNNLERIERNAFMYSNIQTVTLNSGLQSIGDYAFFGNWRLSRIEIPDSVNFVGFNAIRYTNRNAVIRYRGDSIPTTWNTRWNPDGIHTILGAAELIENNDFIYTKSFEGNVITLISINSGFTGKNITIPYSISEGVVTGIGSNAFFGTDIESVVIPSGVTTIDDAAFKNTLSLQTVTFASGIQLTTIGREAFANSSIENITIPNSVETIKEKAFENAFKLSGLSFEADSQLTTIESLAFSWNPVITSYTLPASVSNIAMNAFMSNTSLSSINIDNQYYTNSGGVLFNSGMTILIHYPAAIADNEYVVPYTVKEIAPYAFRNSQFSTIVLPESLKRIGEFAFFDNNKLTSITIPSEVSYVGQSIIGVTNLGLTEINTNAEVTSDWHPDWNTK